MKTTITLLLTILFFGCTNAQAPAIQWQKSLGGSVYDVPRAIQLTTDGGYVMTGVSQSNDGDVTGNNGSFDYWVVKLDATGTIQWQKSLGGSGDDFAQSIQTTLDGGYVVAGYVLSNDGNVSGNHGGSDYWVVKLDATGNIQWQKTLGGSNSDVAYAIQTTFDGGYVIAGLSNSNDGNVTGNHGGYDYWVVKLDATGNIQWQKTLGGSNEDDAYTIKTTSDGGYVVAGRSKSSDGNVTGNHGVYDYWVVKLDATGNIQWQKSLGGSNNDIAQSIHTTSDGGYVVAGYSQSIDGNSFGNHGSYDCWVVKLDAAGNIQWQKSLGGLSDDVAQSINTTSDRGYIIAGYSSSNDGEVTGNHGAQDYWVVKIDAIGNLQWQKSLGGSSSDVAYAILNTSDSGYILAGYSSSNDGNVTGNHGGVDCWVVKLAPEVLVTSAFEKQGIVIYPNPVCDVLQIQTPNNTIISKAKIIDITGKVVLEQTQNSNTINVENLAQGVYILEAYSSVAKYTSKFVKQ